MDILTSAHNEEDGIEQFVAEITRVMDSHPEFHWKLRICDNGSTDGTWTKISNLAELDQRIIGYKMVRSFGFDAALTFCLDQTNADAVILMTSDLQDPPDVIDLFIEEFKNGHQHVVARIKHRKSISFRRRIFTRLFYDIAFKLTDGMFPRDVSDFRLMGRDVYSKVRELREQRRFLRGLIAWTGFQYKILDIERPERPFGISKFDKINFRRVIPWALSSIFAFSSKPLEIIAYSSILFSGLALSSLVVLALIWLFYGVPFNGFGSIFGILILLFSLTFLILGVFALYMHLIYEEMKQRPLYILEKTTKTST